MHPHDNTPEEWRAVVGHEDGYEVSNLGRIRRVRHLPVTQIGHVRALGRITVSRRYQTVQLYRYGRSSSHLVSRLVAEAFLGPPPTPLHEVNHRNGDRSNNRPGNLEWVTRAENVRHSVQTGLFAVGERQWKAKLTADDVLIIREMRGHVSQLDLATRFGVSNATISNVQLKYSWRHI
jgi:hypothetical protein